LEHLAGYAKKADELGSEMELDVRAMPINRAIFWLVAGLTLLIVSFRIMVWGAVEIDHGFEVRDLIIGLTIVAVDTSLSELASSSIATRTILRAGLTAEDPQVRENADRARENLLRLGRFDYLDIE
jgi:hypothetical protein